MRVSIILLNLSEQLITSRYIILMYNSEHEVYNQVY